MSSLNNHHWKFLNGKTQVAPQPWNNTHSREMCFNISRLPYVLAIFLNSIIISLCIFPRRTNMPPAFKVLLLALVIKEVVIAISSWRDEHLGLVQPTFPAGDSPLPLGGSTGIISWCTWVSRWHIWLNKWCIIILVPNERVISLLDNLLTAE